MASKKNTSKTLRVSVKLLMLSVISKIHLRITVRRLIKKYRNFHYYHVFVEKKESNKKNNDDEDDDEENYSKNVKK